MESPGSRCEPTIWEYFADLGSFQGLDEVVASTCRDIGEQFGDNIFDKYGQRLELAHQMLEANSSI